MAGRTVHTHPVVVVSTHALEELGTSELLHFAVDLPEPVVAVIHFGAGHRPRPCANHKPNLEVSWRPPAETLQYETLTPPAQVRAGMNHLNDTVHCLPHIRRLLFFRLLNELGFHILECPLETTIVLTYDESPCFTQGEGFIPPGSCAVLSSFGA